MKSFCLTKTRDFHLKSVGLQFGTVDMFFSPNFSFFLFFIQRIKMSVTLIAFLQKNTNQPTKETNVENVTWYIATRTAVIIDVQGVGSL